MGSATDSVSFVYLVRGQNQVIAADARIAAAKKKVAASTKEVNAATVTNTAVTEENALAQAELTTKMFLRNQALFTARRVLYSATLALAALGAAAVISGIQFDSSMEQSQLAFTRFLGSASAAKQELSFLFNLAAKTPFEFPQLTDATRKFLAFGFTLQETNSLLKDTADAVAAFGLPADAIDRAVLALGQMRAAGRLLGQDVRQLMELGLFSPDDFSRRLGLRPGQIGQIGQLNIPSKVGIDAITAYWRMKFGGASKAFATTFQGQLSTLKDYGRQAFGAMVEPLFLKLRNQILPEANKIALAVTAGAKSGGFKGGVVALDQGLGAGGRITSTYTKLTEIFRNLYIITYRGLFPALTNVYQVLGALFPVLSIIAAATGVLADHTTTLRIAVTFLTAYLLINKAALIGTIIYEHIYTGSLARNTLATKLNVFWQGKLASVLRLVVAGEVALAAALGISAGLLAAVIVAIILIVAGLVILYYKWGAFHDAVNRGAQQVADDFKMWWEWIVNIWNWLHNLANWLDQHVFHVKISWPWDDLKKWASFGIPSFSDPLPSFHATGGMAGGWSWVGEHGPELIRVPTGTQVKTAAASQISGNSTGGPSEVVIPVQVQLDGRVIAEAVASYNLYTQARS